MSDAENGRPVVRLLRAAGSAAAFALHAARRFVADGCFSASGALSYATLVSLVPLAVIALGSLSAFPIFASTREHLLSLVFESFIPSVGEQAAYWFRNFAESATQTTAIGVAGIGATGILLLVTVEDQLNLIWRVTSARPWGQRVLAYWTLITLGPVLIGISLSLSTYFEIAARRAGLGDQAAALLASGSLHIVARALPALLEFTALTLLFSLLPNCAVRWRDGALGALIATIAIEILKIGFAIYIDSFSYYSAVYGALAAIPIFLLWMYISWMAVLLGAVVAAARPNWRIGETRGEAPGGNVRLGLGLALIAALARAQHRGGPRATRSLAAELGVATTVVDEHIRPLIEAGFVAHTQGGRWVLAWSPETATLRDLFAALRLPLAGASPNPHPAPWQRRIAPAMERIVEAEAGAMQLTIASARAARRFGRPSLPAFGIGRRRCQGVISGMEEIVELEPFAPFERWFAEASKAERDADAMTLATAAGDGRPSARMVLLRGHDKRGFVFYTNLESRKSSELLGNPQAALCFHWKPQHRQVRIEGTVAPVADAEADAYFSSRAWESRIGAWASDQSRPLASRALLEQRVEESTRRFAEGEVPRPPFWSGFRVAPERVEFWQERPFRLHDRWLFIREGEKWRRERLFP